MHVPNVTVEAGEIRLEGSRGSRLCPGKPVLFAHGSGSSRASPRNRVVARDFRAGGLGDDAHRPPHAGRSPRGRLDPPPPIRHRSPRGAPRARRAVARGRRRHARASIGSLRRQHRRRRPRWSAPRRSRRTLARSCPRRASRPRRRRASQSRGADALDRRSTDQGVIELNETAFAKMTCVKQLDVVPNATHLFEERGAPICRAARARLVPSAPEGVRGPGAQSVGRGATSSTPTAKQPVEPSARHGLRPARSPATFVTSRPVSRGPGRLEHHRLPVDGEPDDAGHGRSDAADDREPGGGMAPVTAS